MLIGVPNRPPAAALAALGGCVALAGCSLGGGEEPQPASGAAREIGRVVDALERSSRAGDWAGICTDLFSAAARERAGGADCRRLLAETAGDVDQPEIRVLSIEVEGERARVRVRTRAGGQAPAEDTVILVREAGKWRIEALAAG